MAQASLVADTLEVTPQAARRIVLELGLKEMTGRGRVRAWVGHSMTDELKDHAWRFDRDSKGISSKWPVT